MTERLRQFLTPVEIAGSGCHRRYSSESLLTLGSFARYLRVSLVLVGARFPGKRKIWGARSRQNSPFSPPVEGRGEYANNEYQHGKQNQER